MKITKKGKDLLAETSLTPKEFADFLLKFAFMSDEQLAERDALPTKEARQEFMRNLPLPERKK
jgi:hypothetical protein